MTKEKKPRYSRLTDILELVSLMMEKPKGVSLKDICEYFNVSRRTAERMRDAITNTMPMVEEIPSSDRVKRWGFKNYSMPEMIKFNDEEMTFLSYLYTKESKKLNQRKRNIFDRINKKAAIISGVNNMKKRLLYTMCAAAEAAFDDIPPKYHEQMAELCCKLFTNLDKVTVSLDSKKKQ